MSYNQYHTESLVFPEITQFFKEICKLNRYYTGKILFQLFFAVVYFLQNFADKEIKTVIAKYLYMHASTY
jgi:hypothetical protein